MKKVFFLSFLIVNSLWVTAQSQSVSIGTTTPDASAILDLSSPEKGLLIPRMTMSKRDAIASPAKGLIVYVIDDGSFYIYNGAWRRLTPADEIWSIKGNSGTDTSIHFIGTKDISPIMFRVNNVTRMQLDSFGRLKLNSPNDNIFIGYETALNNTGVENQFTGFKAGYSNTNGSRNYFSGYRSGYNNVAGNYNQFIGYNTGFSNTSGSGNLFAGPFAGQDNLTGSANIFIGSNAGHSNTSGSANQFVGYTAGLRNTTGSNNYFSGFNAGMFNITGSQNLFIGYRAGEGNTASFNHFIGFQAGLSNTTGQENHFIGREAGMNNTIGYYNYFSGLRAGRGNISGLDNYFSGSDAGVTNTTGSFNYFAGNVSGYLNTTGDRNHFSGYFSGYSNTTGSANYFNGHLAGYSNTTADSNHFDGYRAGYNNTIGEGNHFSGNRAGESNTTGYMNQFTGYLSGFSNTVGFSNYFSGMRAGYQNTFGFENSFIGLAAGHNNTSGIRNCFIGFQSGYFNTIGFDNYFSGFRSGYQNITGDKNTLVGMHADVLLPNLTKAGAIGFNARVSQSNSFVIGGTGTDAVNVGVGTTAPLTTLDIQSNTVSSTIATFRSTGGFGQIKITQGTTVTDIGAYPTGGYTGTNSVGDFKIRTGSVDRMFFQHTTGFVGVGTNTPSATLHVAGNVIVDGTLSNEALQTPVFQSGWVNNGGGYAPLSYYKDKEGRVHLAGVVYNAAPGPNSIIFKLPPGYRPTAGGILVFPAMNGGTSIILEVTPSGDVVVPAIIGGWISLDGISFRAN
jgi:hypothetical protein